MAIRKFRKRMKPFIWAITIAFAVTSGMAGVSMFSQRGPQQHAFKLNKEKVQRVQVEREKSNVNNSYSRYFGRQLDRETTDLMAFDQVLTKKLTLAIAKDLHVDASSAEVKAQYEAAENSIKDKAQFKRMLSAQGFTKATYKEEIKENIIVQKTIAKIAELVKVSDEDVKAEYEKNKYFKYNGKPFVEVAGEVKANLINKKTMDDYLSLLEAKKEAASITDVAKEYKDIVPQVVLQEGGLEVTNLDINKKAVLLAKEPKDMEEAQKTAKEYYTKQLSMLANAKAEGIEINSKLPIDYQIAQYQEEKYAKIVNSINPTEAELNGYFKENALKYDTLPTAKVDIAIVKIEPSEEDKASAKAKAEKILKEVTPENFAEKAKKLSEGPSAGNGGKLGWFGKGAMVEPFQKAAFEGEAGKVYPQVVETKFGYHVIFVEAKNEKEDQVSASHILIMPKVSEKTLAAKTKDLEQLKNKISNGDIDFKVASQNRADVVKSGEFMVNNAGYISGLGYNEELAKNILDAPLNKVELEKLTDTEFCVFKKLEETKYKKAKLEDVKDEVIADYKNSVAAKELEKSMN